MYNEKAETTLVAVDRSTLHVTDSIELGINTWPTDVQENEDDTITVSEYTLTDTKISEICERVFDADFNEVSGKIIADIDIISDRTIFKEYYSVAEGGYVIFLQNSDNSVDMCRYDAEGNEIYTQSDIMNNILN